MSYIPPSPSNIFEMFSEICYYETKELQLMTYDIVSDPHFTSGNIRSKEERNSMHKWLIKDGGDAGPM